MEMLSNRVKQFILIGLFGVLIGCSMNSFAAKTISVTVAVDRNIAKTRTVIGIGFTVNGKSRGGAGKRTTKTGPAGATYKFGFRDYRSDVSCGSSVLRQNSMVILYFVGNQCTHKVVPKS